MAKIIYHGEEPVVWRGHAFAPGETVEIDDPHLINKAVGNPFFDVVKADMPSDTPFNRGAAAAQEEKKRSVPPAYRGKSEAQDWLDGYDSVKPDGD